MANRSISFNHYPLAIIAAFFAVGILSARLITLFVAPYFRPSPFAFRLSILWLAVCVVGSVSLALLALRNHKRQQPTRAATFVLIAFALAGSALWTLEGVGINTHRVRSLYETGKLVSGAPLEVIGVLQRAPEVAPDGLYLELELEGVRFRDTEQQASGAVWLFAPVRDGREQQEYQQFELRRGARLRMMVELRRAETFRNPGGASFVEYLDRKGFDASGTIKTSLLVERLDDARTLLPLVWLDEWRASLLRNIDRLFHHETAGILKASLLGNRYGLTRRVAERFRDGGTFHILVISGFHITVVGSLAMWLMRRVTRIRVWQFACAALFLWSYTIAVGAEVSVVRAALMFTVASIGFVLHRPSVGLNALGLAALALLAWRPGDLFDASFQLTFLSVLAIVVIAWPLLVRLQGNWRVARDK